MKTLITALILSTILHLASGIAAAQPIVFTNVGYMDEFKDQMVRCELTSREYGFVGPCTAETGATARQSTGGTPFATRWPDEPVWVAISRGPYEDPPWRGFLRIDDFVLAFEIAPEDDPVRGSRLVLRNGFAWLIVNEWKQNESGNISLIFGLSEEAPATEQDVAILRDAVKDLDSIAVWDREDDRNCSNDEAGHMSLFCLLQHSITNQMGHYHHRQPALQIVRKVIRQHWPQRIDGHTIMDFNNNPDTTMDDLHLVLEMAITLAQTEDIDKP
jgi:hypothetical protein